MLPERVRLSPFFFLALCLLLCYPIMAVKWVPLGGGARYLSVLAGPLSLLLLYLAPRHEIRPLLQAAGRWALPFLPFVLCWVFAQLWHGYDPLDSTPLSRLLWCAVLFAGARLAGVNYRHLAIAAGIGAIAYGLVALVEVYGLGRARAWGGTYENRFGQYAIWLAALCCLHVVFARPGERSRATTCFLLGASLFGVVATVLSGARGALLALFVVFFVILQQAADRKRAWLIVAGLLSFVLAVCLLYPPIGHRLSVAWRDLQTYFGEAEFRPTSVGIRLELARISFLMLLEHPLLGPGYTSLESLFQTHPSLGVPSPKLLEIPGFHNDWSQAIGIGGGALLLALAATCAWLGMAARGDVYRQAFLGFALVFGLSELFISNKLGLSLLMVSWALYGAVAPNQRAVHESP
ncbi:MAG: O-antigen ligase family protein [Azonexus sp.]